MLNSPTEPIHATTQGIYKTILVPKTKHNKSMLLWIIRNNKMSWHRKFYRIWVLVLSLIGTFLKDRECTLLEVHHEHQLAFEHTLLRKIATLRKRKYQVTLELSLREKDISKYSQGFFQALSQSTNLRIQLQ